MVFARPWKKENSFLLASARRTPDLARQSGRGPTHVFDRSPGIVENSAQLLLDVLKQVGAKTAAVIGEIDTGAESLELGDLRGWRAGLLRDGSAGGLGVVGEEDAAGAPGLEAVGAPQAAEPSRGALAGPVGGDAGIALAGGSRGKGLYWSGINVSM